MIKIAHCTALLSLAVALGCSDGGGKPRSGVASNKPLNEVDDDDLQKLCDWALGPLRVEPSRAQPLLGEATPRSRPGQDSSGGDPVDPALASPGEAPRGCYDPARSWPISEPESPGLPQQGIA